MFSKAQFLESMAHEVRVLKHLLTKVTPECLDYRPAEGQRSLLELLRYLPHNIHTIPSCYVLRDWKVIGDMMAKTREMTPEQIPAELDAQLARLKELLAGYSESDLAEKQGLLPFGDDAPLGSGLVEFPLKFSAAYRMQLFLYLKAAGRTELVSSNLWRGVDPQPK